MELEHAGLDGEDGILPAVVTMDGHEGAFGGRRDLVELLAFGFELDAGVLRGDGGGGSVAAGEEENGREAGERKLARGWHENRITRGRCSLFVLSC